MEWLATENWLWGLAAFLLGALITWLLLVKRYTLRSAKVVDRARDDFPKADRDGDGDIDLADRPSAEVDAPSGAATFAGGAAAGGLAAGAVATEGRHTDVEEPVVEEPVVSTEPEVAAPEPVAVESEPEPVATQPEPQPEPLAAEPEPFAAAAPLTGPHGTGSAEPLADGSAPSSLYTVKGNADSMLYHTEESPYYGRTKAEVWFDNEENARAAGFTRWDERDSGEVVVVAAIPPGPYGAGSAEPLADGAAPSSAFTVKGNADSMLFHTDESPYYGRTKAEVWFDNEDSARAAGFTRWDER